MTHAVHPHAHDRQKDVAGRDAYWKRAHRDWKFWLAFFLMLAGIGIYITSLDEATGPGPGGEINRQRVVP